MKATRWLVLCGCVAVLGLGACGGGGSDPAPTPPPPPTPPPAPTLVACAPDMAFVGSGDLLMLTGSGFLDNAPGTNVVEIGAAPATAVAVIDDTTLTCRLPAGTGGPADIELTNDNGADTLPGAFTFYRDPSVFLPADVRLDTDPAGTGHSRAIRVCSDGDHVYAVWVDQRNGVPSDIYFNASADGGATWLAADARLDTNAAGAAFSLMPSICCSGENVYVVWQDARNVIPDIYFNRSTDGGTTWLAADVRLEDVPAGSARSDTPQVACAGDVVYVTWVDERNGIVDIFFNRSTDAGTSWQGTDTRLSTDPAGTEIAIVPQIACSGDLVCVVWEDYRVDHGDIHLNRSTDGGMNWLAADRRLDTDVAGDDTSRDPQICVGDSGGVYVAWRDFRNGLADVYFNRSADGGTTWLGADRRLDTDPGGTNESEPPQICCQGQSVYAVWVDRRNGDPDIYLNRSADGGATWQAADMRVNTDPAGTAPSLGPQLASSGDNVFVVWADARVAAPGIRFNRSLDRGVSWLASDLRLDTNPSGVLAAQAPQIACDGPRIFVAWEDLRNGGSADVYFQRSVP